MVAARPRAISRLRVPPCENSPARRRRSPARRRRSASLARAVGGARVGHQQLQLAVDLLLAHGVEHLGQQRRRRRARGWRRSRLPRHQPRTSSIQSQLLPHRRRASRGATETSSGARHRLERHRARAAPRKASPGPADAPARRTSTRCLPRASRTDAGLEPLARRVDLPHFAHAPAVDQDGVGPPSGHAFSQTSVRPPAEVVTIPAHVAPGRRARRCPADGAEALQACGRVGEKRAQGDDAGRPRGDDAIARPQHRGPRRGRPRWHRRRGA